MKAYYDLLPEALQRLVLGYVGPVWQRSPANGRLYRAGLEMPAK